MAPANTPPISSMPPNARQAARGFFGFIIPPVCGICCTEVHSYGAILPAGLQGCQFAAEHSIMLPGCCLRQPGADV
jgi:hypothetical protein